MKECPNCHSEVEDGFDMCWNCSYSFDDKKVVAFEDAETTDITKNIDCLRCKVPMEYKDNFGFQTGMNMGIFTNQESFDLYVCPQCRKVEFFLPE